MACESIPMRVCQHVHALLYGHKNAHACDQLFPTNPRYNDQDSQSADKHCLQCHAPTPTNLRFFRVTRGEQFMHDCSTAPVPSRQGPPGKSLRTCTEDSSPLPGQRAFPSNRLDGKELQNGIWWRCVCCPAKRTPVPPVQTAQVEESGFLSCRGWSYSAGFGPTADRHCGTRRFTTRVAQFRAAAAPCRRFLKPPNATAETTPRLLGIGPSLRRKEARKKKNAKPIRSCTHAYGSVSRPLWPDPVEYW